VPADVHALIAATGLPELHTDAPLNVQTGALQQLDGYTLQPLSFNTLANFPAAAALYTPSLAHNVGVLVLPGHFGDGKSAPESQAISHTLAMRGYTVLAVDPPGYEQFEDADHQVHGEDGAHNRAVLAAAGLSALALQLQTALRGVDALLAQPKVERIAVAGASGGAVLGLYALLADPRIEAGAYASFVPLPREARASGCPCDAIPGWPGPDPKVLAAINRPTIWVSEVQQPRPSGLPKSATFVVQEGPHGFPYAQRKEVVRWLDRQFRRPSTSVPEQVAHVDRTTLVSAVDAGDSIAEIALKYGRFYPWKPKPVETTPYELKCQGTGLHSVPGPVVLTLGSDEADDLALNEAGYQHCDLIVTRDSVDEAAAIVEQRSPADRPAGAIAVAARRSNAVAVYAVGPYAVAAVASGVPAVVRDPVRDLSEVRAADPIWVHFPGAWWGGTHALYSTARYAGTDREAAIAAIRRPSMATEPPND